MERKTSDFRKWIAYSNEFTSSDEIQSIFDSVRKLRSNGNVQFNKTTEQGEVSYTIQYGSSEILKLTEAQRNEFLRYLGDHYLIQEAPQKHPAPEKTATRISVANPPGKQSFFNSPEKESVTIGKRLSSPNIFVHALRFGIIGLIFFQFAFFVDQVLEQDIIPKTVTGVYSFVVLAILAHASVRLYRKHFTLDGSVGFGFVWRLTTLFCIIVFLGSLAETILLALMNGKATLLATLLMFIMFLFAAVFVGLLISVMVYFTNRGKVSSSHSEAY